MSFGVDPDWNRWILSHHISFLLWALCVIEMDGIVGGAPSVQEGVERVALCTTAYGSMLRYARLIGSQNYARSIRPVMSQFYPGFSATWSSDYQLYKQRILQLLKSPDPQISTVVRREFMDSLQDHLATAKQLVPNGPSLLQSIKNAHGKTETATKIENFVYDSLFLVSRTAVASGDLTAQLRARVRVLHEDPLLAAGCASNERILADVARALAAVDQQPEPAV
jgi:hypothetical protein